MGLTVESMKVGLLIIADKITNKREIGIHRKIEGRLEREK